MRPASRDSVPGLLDETPIEFLTIGGINVPTEDTVFSEAWELSEKAIFTEAAAGEKKKGLGTVTWKFRTGNVLNVNKRIYPTHLLAKEVARVDKIAKAGRLYGELDHPTMFMDQTLPALDRASHRITAVTMDGDYVTVEAIILDNPKGQQLASCYRSGGDVGVSHRCAVKWREASETDRHEYSLSRDTSAVVAADLRLITYDAVSDPGFPDAFTRRVLVHESKQRRIEPMPFTLEEARKPENKAVYDVIVAEGKALGLAELETAKKAAVEAAKPTIVAEAVAPVNTKLATTEEALKVANATLDTVRGALVTGKVITLESAGNAEVQAKVTTLTTENATLKSQFDTTNKALTDANAKITELTNKAGVAEAVIAVESKYKDQPDPQRKLIVDAARAAATKDAAIAAADAKAVELEQVKLTLTGGGNGPANTTQNGGGGGGGGDKPSTAKAGVANVLGGYGV